MTLSKGFYCFIFYIFVSLKSCIVVANKVSLTSIRSGNRPHNVSDSVLHATGIEMLYFDSRHLSSEFLQVS